MTTTGSASDSASSQQPPRSSPLVRPGFVSWACLAVVVVRVTYVLQPLRFDEAMLRCGFRAGRERSPLHLAGALLNRGAAVTVAKSIIDPPRGRGHGHSSRCSRWSNRLEFRDLVLRAAHLVFAALIGGLVGAAIASASTVHWMTGVVSKVIVPMILSPLVGFVGGHLLMIISLWVLRKANPHRVGRGFRIVMRSLR